MSDNTDPNNSRLVHEKKDDIRPESSSATADGEASPQDLEDQNQRLPYPKSVFFIVSNEFCERFSFYGMRTVLSLYLSNQLKFSTSTATVIFHAFIMICYFFPLLGAIVADSWLGKYKTILYLSIVYAVGNIVVSTAAIPGSLPPVLFTMLGLVLIALGTGGIKPCVSAFGGDQFVLPQQDDQLQKFFSIFYFAINSGSFISTFLTPILREQKCFGEDSCYSLAFGVPALLMILSIVIYFSGKRFYKMKKPEGNVVVKVASCMWYAATKGGGNKKDHWLDKAQDKFEIGFIADIKAALKVLFLYIPLPIFWALFDQQGSRWTFQAARMNGEVGSFKIQPDQMQVLNPILILAFIPLFETVLYPLLGKCNLLKRPLQRLTVGGILAATSFALSAFVEFQLEPTYPVLPTPTMGQVRLYNGLSETLNVNIPELQQSFNLPSLGMWEKVDFVGEKTFQLDYSYGKVKNSTAIKITPNTATSYTFMPDKLLVIENENIDKSDNGNPKVMIIYSDAETYVKKEISFYDGSKKFDRFFGTVTPKNPFINFTKIELSSGKYTLKVDQEEVLREIEFKQGGVYTVPVVKISTGYNASVVTVTKPNSIHILWLTPQYVIITAGEIMFSITGLEFSFTQAPKSMKSLLQAAWLITVALGNLIVVIIAEAKIFSSQKYEFLLFASLMLLDMLVFAIMASKYTYVEDLVEKPTEKDEDERK